MTGLLVFSATNGYRHDSIPAGVAALRDLGAEAGFDVDATEDPTYFTTRSLRGYDAVVFLSSSGTVFDDEQRAALERFVRDGGGYVGIHAASTTEYDWPFYGELAGARFDRHPPVQPGVITVEDHDHPATAHLPARWEWTDEWYDFRSDPRPHVRVLLSVDEDSYEGGRMGPGHPIAWCHRVGSGRCFYTALGHTAEAFDEPVFRAHLHGGITSVLPG
ncbi:hypothetical protein CLV30_102358 [Haloactinopolyspora alba]|uniref:ThuA-like domain-containing protein n=1 Tax=Haloactinopolyspora alba TaxID=648780 RepID=A0A2P8EBW3_9ACTN|nr:ThuA domain-containing protein [Haloactinopolyspora alba]PSL06969.1 hypothetical protein CLV30_102358 [Haloactinopolyspora alba]